MRDDEAGRRRDECYARIAYARGLPSSERRVAHSDAALREPFMHVHAVRCILLYAPRVAVPLSAVPRSGCSPSRVPTCWLTHADPLMVRLPNKT